MWNNTSFGGFENETKRVSTDKPKPVNRNTVMPVTVKQLLTCQEQTISVGGVDAGVVVIVGLVREVNSSPTKVSMWVDDQTGTIECVSYTGMGFDGNDGDPLAIAEGTYGRFIGNLRIASSGNYINIFRSFPVTDLNEMTCHLLEVLSTGQKLEKMQEEKKAEESTTNVEFGDTSGVFGADGGLFTNGSNKMMPRLTLNQNLVYRFIASCKSQEGVHRNEIFDHFKGKMQTKELELILGCLGDEGNIYSTSDDDHFATT